MTLVNRRDQLISDLAAARAQVKDAVAGLNEAQMSRPDIDGWSVKDQLSHLTVCDEIRFHEIVRVSRGGRPAWANFDGKPMHDFNEMTASLRRDLPIEQVMADLDMAREKVLDAIAEAPERALASEAYGEEGYAVDGSIEHDASHAVAITAWRKQAGL
jgi:uncharacterized damage-inducible protein DinB